VRVLCLKDILLSTEVEIQNYLLFEIFKHLVTSLVGYVDAVVDSGVAGLELVKSLSLFIEILNVEKILALVRGILDILKRN
jgi:hypothetical protein